MMAIAGNYTKKFADANIACATDVSMNADLPHFWFDVVSVEGGNVTLTDREETVTLPIKSGKRSEHVEFPMVSSWEKLFKNGVPSIYRFVPFKGKRL